MVIQLNNIKLIWDIMISVGLSYRDAMRPTTAAAVPIHMLFLARFREML
jgi:hypothetical protein